MSWALTLFLMSVSRKATRLARPQLSHFPWCNPFIHIIFGSINKSSLSSEEPEYAEEKYDLHSKSIMKLMMIMTGKNKLLIRAQALTFLSLCLHSGLLFYFFVSWFGVTFCTHFHFSVFLSVFLTWFFCWLVKQKWILKTTVCFESSAGLCTECIKNSWGRKCVQSINIFVSCKR